MLYTNYIQTIYKLYTYYTHTIYILYTNYIHTIYILYTYYIHTIYILYTYYIHTIYILYTYYIHTILAGGTNVHEAREPWPSFDDVDVVSRPRRQLLDDVVVVHPLVAQG